MKKSHTLSAFCHGLKRQNRFLLSCHSNPEGDAIGSILAVESLLRRLGKKTKVVCEDPFPNRLSCLSSKRWNQVADIAQSKFEFDALVLADCPNKDRIGEVQKLLRPGTVLFNLDHHISNTFFGHYNYVRPEASATGEVVMDLFKHLRMPLTREDATNIYVAISTDTGSFKYSNTTVRSHQIVCKLIRTGIDIEKINEKLYSTYSLNKINLYGRLLRRIKTAADGSLAWVTMKSEDLKRSGATYEDTEDVIDFLRFLKEVKVAFFISELSGKKEVKVSFRSKGAHDVNKIAMFFGGGGHKKAAACRLKEPLRKVEKMVLNRLLQMFHGGDIRRKTKLFKSPHRVAHGGLGA